MFLVAPLVGAWIEMFAALVVSIIAIVAPLVGAWIEMLSSSSLNAVKMVAPLVGAWIEMFSKSGESPHRPRRSPCGSVD